LNSEGTQIGISKNCGKEAVLKTGLSRMVLPIPAICLPGVAYFTLDKLGMYPKTGKKKIIFEFMTCVCSLWYAVPLACSVFP
jgi:hypothetical protein